jgi:hypothetical protein
MSGLHPYQITMSNLGQRVNRAAAALPATTQSPLFTIAGGRILLTYIVGEVTTAIQNQANNTQLVYNHATASDVDLCADLNIANDAVGEQYSITGTFADAMVSGFALAATIMANPILLQEGTIDLDCAATNTGAVAWTLFYLPLDDGAVVTAY